MASITILALKKQWLQGLHRGGGHSHWKRVWGCAEVMTPNFSLASRRSLAYQFTVNVPLLSPLFLIFRKFLHFQPCFGQNSSSLNPNFSKFLFPRPPFCKKNPLPRPYILKHIHQKKKVECPPWGFIPWLPPRGSGCRPRVCFTP